MSSNNSNNQPQFDITYKVLLLGDSSVGKSCVFLRLTQGTFTDNFVTTIGIDFKYKKYRINNEDVGLQLWDTAGQERYISITRNYFRQSKGIVLVYDVSNRTSFEGITKWIKSLKDNQSTNDLVLMLLGNKCDLDKELRQVSYGEGENFAYDNKLLFYECSAKEGTNINEAFQLLIEKIDEKRRIINNIDNQSPEISGKKLIGKIKRRRSSVFNKCCTGGSNNNSASSEEIQQENGIKKIIKES